MNLRALMTACVVGAIAAATDELGSPLPLEQAAATTQPLAPDHPWPGPPGRDEAALDLAIQQREERRQRLERDQRKLAAWREKEQRRTPCASVAAAFYREQRLLAKRRSRELGHGG